MPDTSRSTQPTSATDEDPQPFVVGTIEQVKALTHPLRQRILERFAVEARTTKQVADELGEKPTRLYHHVSALERAGLIRLVETRQKRGTTEKYYAAVAQRFEIDPRAFSQSGKLSVRHPSIALLDSLFENTRVELADLIEHVDIDALAEQAIFMRVEIRGDRKWIDTARQKLDAFIQQLQEEAPDEVEETEAQRLLLGWYPLRR